MKNRTRPESLSIFNGMSATRWSQFAYAVSGDADKYCDVTGTVAGKHPMKEAAGAQILGDLHDLLAPKDG